jgi:hypothetical protein
MEKAKPANMASVDEEIKETHTIDSEPSRDHASLLGEASSFLIALGVRAAQNHVVYCLDDWIAPSQVLDDLTFLERRNHWPNRVSGGCDKQPVA